MFLREKRNESTHLILDPASRDHWHGFITHVEASVSKGKRLRPKFCLTGWWASGQTRNDERVTSACAALELLHTFALVHDDIMDASDCRRGMPSLHRRMASMHRAASWRGNSAQYGNSVAILAGDLLLGWSHELLDTCSLPPAALAAARKALFAGYHELVIGQYLDIVGQASDLSAASISEVNRLKTAKYTVELPLRIGAILGGGNESLLTALSSYALPLGQAFQLRDDVLGLFGNPHILGKPIGEDLRRGNSTFIVACALQRATRAQRAIINAAFGNPHIDEKALHSVLDIVIETGALATVEACIAEFAAQARTAAHEVPANIDLQNLLLTMTTALTERDA